MTPRARTTLPILNLEAAAAPDARAAAVASAGSVRIGLITLGCDKNTVDSERLLARLAAAGAEVEASARDADVIVVNTCGFIDVAKEESIDALLEAIRLKQQGRARAVVAVGCLVQRYQTQLAEELPEVDLFLRLTEVERLVPVLRERGLLAAAAPNMQRPLLRLSKSGSHTSYLKVSEGCDHKCAFCAIPLMRGLHRSVPIEQLVAEARELEARGVVELNLISQDTTWYGRDLIRGVVPVADAAFVGRPFRGMPGIAESALVPPVRGAKPANPARHGLLPELLTELLRNTAIPWLRLFYLYPSGVSRELVELIAREPRIVRYLDTPIQHGSDRVLERMRRPERYHTIVERTGWLREAIPELALRTTVIVGFPGETDDDFHRLLDLLEEVRFDYLGAFVYSVEEDTPAATMPDQVPDSLKRERLEELLDRQRSITASQNERRLGTVVPVLIDRLIRPDSGLATAGTGRGAIGRGAFQAAEIDGVVHIAEAIGLKVGQFAQVRLLETIDHDLVGEVAEGL